MKLFLRKNTEIVPMGKPAEISVPDIKDYLVKEYERVAALKMENERLEAELEEMREIELKYKAAMVTLDEYGKRLEAEEAASERLKDARKEERKQAFALRDEVNSYKIRLHNAALTKEEIREEIAEAVKSAIVKAIMDHKGNLSKKVVCEIIAGVVIGSRKEVVGK